MRSIIQLLLFIFIGDSLQAQIKWRNVDSFYQPLPQSVHIYITDDSLDNVPFRAYYLIADLKDKKLEFTVDTSKDRRLKPQVYYERNDKALSVVNTTFFSFETNRNLNVVVRDGKLLAYNNHSIPGRGKDTFTYRHVLPSAIAISRDRAGDVAWVHTDSFSRSFYAYQVPMNPVKDSIRTLQRSAVPGRLSQKQPVLKGRVQKFFNWKEMKTAVGGGPVLIQGGAVRITNNEELRFPGKAIADKHPRTAMGYTRDHKLIILVIEGRNPNAAGATLIQEAELLKDLGCWEALNLDGGGSSCLLVNGKETIKPSDKEGQRAVPGVFIIKRK